MNCRGACLVKSFEGVRGLAALIVALFHLELAAQSVAIIRYGYLFVDLFFVLSGFVICRAYGDRLNERLDFSTFLIRRFGRLFPLLVASSVLFVLVRDAAPMAKTILVHWGGAHWLAQGPGPAPMIPTLSEVVATLTMTQGMGIFDHLILNYATWSISTEFYTYVLFAAICLSLRGRPRALGFGLVGLVAFALTVWATLDVHGCVAHHLCYALEYDYGYPRCVSSFFLGALLVSVRPSARWTSTFLQMVLVAALLLFFSTLDALPALALAIPFVFAVLLLSISRDSGWLGRVLASRPFQFLGERSYSIYLMHPVVLAIPFAGHFRHSSPVVTAGVMVIYLGCVIVLSGWTYRLIEAPFRRRFNAIAVAYQANAGSFSRANPTAT